MAIRVAVFSVCNAVLHPANHRFSSQLACVCVRLYHHDDNSGRRPQAVIDAINVQAHRKSSRMDVKSDVSSLENLL